MGHLSMCSPRWMRSLPKLSKAPKTLIVLLVALLLGAITPTDYVRAEPVQFSYQWLLAPAPVEGKNNRGENSGVISFALAKGTDVASLNDPLGVFVKAAEVTSSSSANVANPDRFQNTLYQLSVSLTDTQSGQTGVIGFQGMVTGDLRSDFSSLENKFLTADGEVTLGGRTYRVSIEPEKGVFPSPIAQAGTLLNAHVLINGTDNPPPPPPPPPVNTPEPSTLVLSGLALTYFGVRWRRRRGKDIGV